jgi:NADH-quinone oxidoreductase subunit D
VTIAPEQPTQHAPTSPSGWPIVGPPIYEGTRIPSPVPTLKRVPESLRGSDDVMTINFGPNHPSTHGVLRLIVDLLGEEVVGLEAKIGYVHTGFEKNMEAKSWWKAITYAPRIDYVAFQNNELVFVLAVEKLLGLAIPEKATWMRMLLAELNRIHSHLVWLGTSALEIGAISMFWYTFRERDMVLDLSELVAGYRMHTRYFQVGGLAEDIPRGFYPEARKFVEWMPKAIDDYDDLLMENEIWLARTKGIGLLSAQDAIALGQSGPVLRASGVDWDLRREQPYLAYDRVDFRVPVHERGDTYDRYLVRVQEMRESVRIVEQCLNRLERLESEPWIADDRKVVLPPREELHTSMESLIHHFKIVTEGFRVPEGEVYLPIESPRGELGCYLVSDGGARPWRVKFRAPGFAALEATATCMHEALVADLIAIVGSLDTVMGEVDR